VITGEFAVQAEITDKMLRSGVGLKAFRSIRFQMRNAMRRLREDEGLGELPEYWSHERYVTDLFSNCAVSGPHWHYTLTQDRNEALSGHNDD
tara:strand:+ start:865 stop:1140 length:276 start_codon:yes stop_codon:yes gene_type:complete